MGARVENNRLTNVYHSNDMSVNYTIGCMLEGDGGRLCLYQSAFLIGYLLPNMNSTHLLIDAKI